MPKISYTTKKMGSAALELVDQVNDIVAEYREMGLVLTLRQIYYQFVARGLIANNDKNYKRIGDVVSDARMAGLVDWHAIEDRTRFLRKQAHWDSPAEIVESCAQQFRVDLWSTQPRYVEVWVEKDALIGVVEQACTEFDVPHFSCRGYTSQTALWDAGQRLANKIDARKEPIVLHFGDHDPSGIDMTRDIKERLALFVGEPIEVQRLALNMPQVRKYNPPPNPAKLTDSRCAGYVQSYGDESWELDALDPRVLITLIQRTVEEHLDLEAWDLRKKEQADGREKLQMVSNRWDEIVGSGGE